MPGELLSGLGGDGFHRLGVVAGRIGEGESGLLVIRRWLELTLARVDERIIRDRRSEHLALDVWIADVRLHGQRELRTLANGMRRDRAAVQAALTTTYTSGAVEGNVTRIKLLKRQMYGRANFDLLRRRILLSP
ncbi:transposase [Streptomyces sp. NPDC059447]|uniref:transposase n=1 Tax=unclassified Streptomyces TaxID=2593676 RepID=UPI0036969C14